MKPVIFVVPGILARSEEQHQPLGFERFGDVRWVEYGEHPSGFRSFQPYAVISNLAVSIEHELRTGREVILFGSSLGGNIVAFVSEKLIFNSVDTMKLRVVIVDAPAGHSTLRPIPGWVPPRVAASGAFNWFLRVIGPALLAFGRTKAGLPKDNEISVPNGGDMHRIAGRDDFDDDQEWRDWVKKTAKRGLEGHDVGVWADQLSWMIQNEADGSLDRAVRSLWRLNAFYVECNVGNVVTQPAAREWWAERMVEENRDGSHRQLVVNAVHCGYLQQYREFKPVIEPLLKF